MPGLNVFCEALKLVIQKSSQGSPSPLTYKIGPVEVQSLRPQGADWRGSAWLRADACVPGME